MIFFVHKKEKKTHESRVFLRKKLKKNNQNAPLFFNQNAPLFLSSGGVWGGGVRGRWSRLGNFVGIV